MYDDQEDRGLDPQEFVMRVTQGGNLAGDLEQKTLDEIAQKAVQDFDRDKESMADWLQDMEEAIDLAALVKEQKTYPFNGAANIKYPLVTTAALQFNARAYPAIVPSADLVKVKVWGPDPQGQKAARGARVAPFMTWQLMSEMQEWERETDKLLMVLPIVGDMFRKVWHDGERPRCKLIDPGKFIVNANAQNIVDAPRCSEEVELYPHEIEERVNSGWFVEFDYENAGQDEDEPHTFIEMHMRHDLDEDGYPEPYIATVHKERQTLVRLVADFGPEDVTFQTEARPVEVVMNTPVGPVPSMQMQEVPVGIEKIRRSSYFVHYQFMPGMRPGLFGTGLGLLLKDISETVNTTFNQLIDAGHFASLGGGFIGSEFRIRGGSQGHRPGEYRMVNARGSDIKSAIVEKTFPGPDGTLFQMLGMLIEAGREISSTKDILSGDGRGAANMPATTAMALIEQGMKVFTASYKRIFRSLKHEFRLLANINAVTLNPQKYAAFLEQEADPRADFGAMDMDIEPVADPNAVTKTQEMARAQLLMELAQGGMLDPTAATMRILEAASIDDIQELLPQPDPAQQQMQMQMAQMDMALRQAQVAQAQADIEETIAKIGKLRADAAETMAGVDLDAKRLRLDALEADLKNRREALKVILAETGADIERDNRRADAGMAGQPRDAGAQGGVAAAIGQDEGRDGSGLLGGQDAL